MTGRGSICALYIHQTIATQPNFIILKNPIQIHYPLVIVHRQTVLVCPIHLLEMLIYLLQKDPVVYMWLWPSFERVQRKQVTEFRLALNVMCSPDNTAILIMITIANIDTYVRIFRDRVRISRGIWPPNFKHTIATSLEKLAHGDAVYVYLEYKSA